LEELECADRNDMTVATRWSLDPGRDCSIL